MVVHPPILDTPGLDNDTVATGDTGQFWSTEEGPTFAEFLDIINPLHHIPGISTLYRAISGDEIGAGPRFVGGMLFGGPLGALAAGVAALFEEASGGNLGHHLAEMIDDVTGGGDTPAVAASSANAGDEANARNAAVANAGTVTGQQAALPTATPAAATLNRIALNPAAALGAVQAMPMGARQTANQNTDGTAAGAATQTVALASIQAAAPAAALPKGARIFPAHPDRAAAARPMLMPFAGNRPDGIVRASAPAPHNAAAQPAAPLPAHPAAQSQESEVSAAVSRSRRQQADLMLAQWAAQQMAQQNAAPGSGRKTEKDDAPAEKAAAHPMLPPHNASPEWYAQAMNKALNRYQAGSNTLPAGVPALSVTR